MSVRIRELVIYPVKGCRGIPVARARVEPTGLAFDAPGMPIGDREWVVVDDEGAFLSQREWPAMALVETALSSSHLRLKAPGMLTLEVAFASEGDVMDVRVWNDTVAAVTQGAVADAWFTRYLGTPARLMRFDPQAQRLSSARYTAPHAAPYKFADAFALLVTGDASLADLNTRLTAAGAPPATTARFRPNIVLDGLPPYEEDYLRTLRAGGVVLRAVKRCSRCTVPGVDPQTGVQGTAVPDALAAYRRTDDGVLFGMNAIVVEGAGAELRAGMTVDVELDL
jgi:hypothetical protein